MQFWVVVSTVFLVAASQALSSQSSSLDLCSWQSKTQPDPLKGNQGTSVKDDYWFTHLSDVDKEGQQHHFISMIKNNHPSKLLPAEWRRGNGKVQIKFERIAAESCAASDFHTLLSSFKEDPQAIIKYGPASQYNKEAPLYVTVETTEKQQGPQLRSRIVGDLQEEGQPKYRLHLEFTTQVKERDFIYTATNLGTNSLLFRIPGFSNAWESLGKTIPVEYKSRWKTQGDAFVAPANREPQTHDVRAEAMKGIREALVQVEVLSSTGKPIAAAQITVFLPLPLGK